MARKNFLMQIRIETELWEKLKKEASDQGIKISELCRQKIKVPSQISRIEYRLDKIEKILLK